MSLSTFQHRVNLVRDRIGREYLDPAILPREGTEAVREDFRLIGAVTSELYKAIPFLVNFTRTDPYPDARTMRERVYATGIIHIFTGSSGHPVMSEDENNMGRAVHDVFAHLVCGCPFTFQGEYNAYLTQREHYPSRTWSTLFAEIPAQTAAFYAAGSSFDYRQRAFRAPAHWQASTQGFGRSYPDANPNLLRALAA